MPEPFVALRLSRLEDGRVHVDAIQSPAGNPQADATLPYRGALELEAIAFALEAIRFELPRWQRLPAHFDALRRLELADEGGFRALREQVGRALFGALCPEGGLREAIHAALNAATAQEPALIELRFDSRATRLAAYPWELLYDDERGFLFNKPTASLARYVACALPVPALAAAERLNLLLIKARPLGDPELALLTDHEEAAIDAGLGAAVEQGRFQRELLPAASPEASTWERLNEYRITHYGAEAPHIVHIDAHGGYGRRCAPPPSGCGRLNPMEAASCACGLRLDADAQGYVAFEGRDRRPHWVSADELAGQLTGMGVRLAVLTTCRSAVVAGQSVFSGMGPRLIQADIPAVVAMQFSVSVEAAAQFTRYLYMALGQRDPLTRAVSQARTALSGDATAWYRPALYLRTNPENVEGRLFVPIEVVTPPPAPGDGEPPPSPQPRPEAPRAPLPTAAPERLTLEIHADDTIKAVWLAAEQERRAEGRLPPDEADVRQDIRLACGDAWTGKLDDRDLMKRLGEKIYATLFPGQVGALFEDAIEQVRADRAQDRSRRLQLALDVDPDSALAREGWPLELLYAPSAEWLATSPFLSLYRRGGSDVRARTPARPPLRALLIVSLPEGLGGSVTPELIAALGKVAGPVEGAGAQARMQLRLLGLVPGASGGGAVELLGLPATYANIKAQVESWAPDVVQFIGHGRFTYAASQGELALLADDGPSPRWVPNETFASLFLGQEPPQALLLQGCEGACSGSEPALMDLVHELAARQIPALVATQFTLSNRYATIFAVAFYKALCAGERVDVAVQSGRAAISSASLWGDRAFASPALFASSPAPLLGG